MDVRRVIKRLHEKPIVFVESEFTASVDELDEITSRYRAIQSLERLAVVHFSSFAAFLIGAAIDGGGALTAR